MNVENVHYLNIFLGAGAIFLQIVSLLTLFLLFFVVKNRKQHKFLDYINKHFFILAFLIAFFASAFPLVYSEIVNFLPCFLCWWQRVFMFPSFILFATALWHRPARVDNVSRLGGDRAVLRYVTPLVVIGFLISVYHNFFYYFGETSSLPCDASGVSCYQHLVSEFGGYISIPMLSLTAFFALLTLLAVSHFSTKIELEK